MQGGDLIKSVRERSDVIVHTYGLLEVDGSDFVHACFDHGRRVHLRRVL